MTTARQLTEMSANNQKENTVSESTRIQAVEVLNALEFRIGTDAWTPLDPAAKAAWREWADAEVASMSDEAVVALTQVRLGNRADRDLAEQRLPHWPGRAELERQEGLLGSSPTEGGGTS